MIQGAVAFAVAAKESRLEQIVGLSQWLASPSHPSLATRQSWLVDRLFSMTPGVAHTIVNPGFFADAYLVTIGLAAHLGVFPWMYGNSRNAPPSNEDIARVAVGALMNPARHAGQSYRPTGPELLGADDMAQAIGRAVGRSVRVVPTPAWLFMKAARMAGMSIDLMSNVRYYIDDHKRGGFELGAPTTDVLNVTGRSPEDFETIAQRYAAQPRNQRTIANWVREFAEFMISPVSPGFNFDRYDRELRRPFPFEPQSAPESKVWRREHGITDPAKRQRRSTTRPLLPPAALNGRNLNRRNYANATRFFRKHCIQLNRVGNRHRPVHLAGTPAPATGRCVAALLILHSFRFIGLAFLVPGVVSPDLPSAFARSAAYGDLVAAILALLALISLPSATGVAITWLFNLWGTADLFNAFYQANHAGLMAGQLGATYFIPTFIVPLLLITHGLGFRILLQHQKVSTVQQSRHAV
jgi:NAD(P)H dehydrogenase (quinone)